MINTPRSYNKLAKRLMERRAISEAHSTYHRCRRDRKQGGEAGPLS